MELFMHMGFWWGALFLLIATHNVATTVAIFQARRKGLLTPADPHAHALLGMNESLAVMCGVLGTVMGMSAAVSGGILDGSGSGGGVGTMLRDIGIAYGTTGAGLIVAILTALLPRMVLHYASLSQHVHHSAHAG